MTTVATSSASAGAQRTDLIGKAAPSPAGPIEPQELSSLPLPPARRLPRLAYVLWFGQRQWHMVFSNRARFGDVWGARGYVPGRAAITCHPDHIRSLFTASPDLVPTLAAESPLRPVLGPNSVLTANGPRHMRQRKLLLPPFHGEAIVHYQRMIAAAAEREITRWPIGKPIALAPRMQAITLDVIMSGIFGIEGRPRPGTPEGRLRLAIRQLLRSSTLPGAKLAELMNLGHEEPFGLTWLGLLVPDRCVYAVIAKRREDPELEERRDILSLMMRARTEEGEALTDRELRDELFTLVLAGHETTANQLAWAWERLVRHPESHEWLVESVRAGSDEAGDAVEATITEAMRCRPVIPMTGRRVTCPWRLGEYGVPAGTPIGISILLLHHREDLYPDPHVFRPERWLIRGGSDQEGASALRKPGTYEWIPFGGGTRRCLGAALAMAEQRIVLETMARQLDLEAPTDAAERPKHRNVTMIPSRGGRVVVRARRVAGASGTSAAQPVPRAGDRDVLTGLQRYFRPGTARSPLRRLGDRFFVEVPGLPRLLVTCSPDDAKAMFMERDGALSLGEALNRFSPHQVLFGGDNVIFLEGDEHARERRTLAPPFHGEMMKSYEQAIVGIALEGIERWPTSRPVEFLELAREFVLRVMRTVIFGVSDHERMRRLDRAMLKYCQVAESDGFFRAGALGVLLTGRWRRYPPLDRAAAVVDEIVLEEIAERRHSGSFAAEGRADFLGMFLERTADDVDPKDDATIARDMRGLTLAGYETTAISLAWIAETLAHHPAILARLVESVDAGEHDYLDAVIAEVMRVRPVFPFTARRARCEFDLDGVRVPRGAVVVISIIALHERPDLYPDPLQIRPERFLEARPGTYTWVTFGGGAHRCLGAAFAQFESRVLFRTLLQRRRLTAGSDRSERPRRAHPMLVPGRGARVVLGKR
jgi:cytochrome P450